MPRAAERELRFFLTGDDVDAQPAAAPDFLTERSAIAGFPDSARRDDGNFASAASERSIGSLSSRPRANRPWPSRVISRSSSSTR